MHRTTGVGSHQRQVRLSDETMAEQQTYIVDHVAFDIDSCSRAHAQLLQVQVDH